MPDGVHGLVEEFAHNARLIDAATAEGDRAWTGAGDRAAGEATTWDRLPLDGLIVVDPVPDDPAVRELGNRAAPIVTVGKLPEDDVDTRVVDNDYAVGTAAMLDHLVGSGARRVGIMTLSIGESFETDSLAAYRSWSEGRGSEPWVYATEHIDWASPRTWAGSRRSRGRRHRMLDAPDMPDALYCLSESYAMAVLAECARRGIDVPGDLMVAPSPTGGSPPVPPRRSPHSTSTPATRDGGRRDAGRPRRGHRDRAGARDISTWPW